LNLWEIETSVFVYEYKEPLRELRKITTPNKHTKFYNINKNHEHIHNRKLLTKIVNIN